MNAQKSKLLSISEDQKKFLAFATIAALVVAILFLREYLMLIAIAAIAAYVFYPIYRWLLRKRMKQGTASLVTFLITLLLLIIPLTFVIVLTIGQIRILVDSAQANTSSIDYSNFLNNLLNKFNQLMVDWGINFNLTTSEISSWLTSSISSFGSTVLNSLASSVTGFFALITSFIIYIYVFVSLLKNHKFIIETIGYLNPLGKDISNFYLRKMASMTKAMIRGQFIIAFCQGTWSAAVLYLVGFNNLFFFFWVLLTIMSIIPLGAGIITIPMGIVMILFGNVWQGVVLILNHLLVVTNIDNVLRPSLVPKDARLDPALTMLSVFGGIAAFGFPGIVLGPVLMIVIVTTVQMFLEVFRSVDSLDESNSPHKKRMLGYLYDKLSSPLRSKDSSSS